jgi:hypothetical protein
MFGFAAWNFSTSFGNSAFCSPYQDHIRTVAGLPPADDPDDDDEPLLLPHPATNAPPPNTAAPPNAAFNNERRPHTPDTAAVVDGPDMRFSSSRWTCDGMSRRLPYFLTQGKKVWWRAEIRRDGHGWMRGGRTREAVVDRYNL